jgi:hypothetical protein
MDGRRFEAGKMLILNAAASRVQAVETSTVMVLGGEPVGERFIYWNFVSSSTDRLEQAASDWKAGRMKLPDVDDAEFIPLPGGASDGCSGHAMRPRWDFPDGLHD